MLTHYLKIAFRNLTKYKMQTIISIIGLAVGFVCFALSALWLRYERSFDTFHPNAENIFIATNHEGGGSLVSERVLRTFVPDWLLTYLPNRFPEVQRTASVRSRGFMRVTVNNVEVRNVLAVDKSFFEMFGVRILQGSIDFHTPDTHTAAITAQKARQLFGNESPIGKTFETNDRKYTFVAIVSGWTGPSNFPYDILIIEVPDTPTEDSRRGLVFTQALLQLYPTVNAEAFLERLENHTPENEMNWGSSRYSAVPLTSLRTSYEFNPMRTVRFQYIVWFSLIGLLVIACALFNYFTLFFSRFRIRQKEFALRLVCGASTKSLFVMLATEFLMLLLIASALGLLLTRLYQPFFENLSSVDLPLSTVLLEVFLYFLAVMAIALLVFFLLLLIFKKRSLNAAIRKRKSGNARRLSVMFQLIVSIALIFCTTIIVKQLNYLSKVDNLGIDFSNSAIVTIVEDPSAVETQLQQIPAIEQFFCAHYAIFPRVVFVISQTFIQEWDGQVPGSEEEIPMEEFRLPPGLIEFYGLQLVAGEFLSEGDDRLTVMINESAVRAFGWYDAVGKTFVRHWGSPDARVHFHVKGVLRNIQTATTVPVAPAMFQVSTGDIRVTSITSNRRPITRILIRYREGTRDVVVNRINELFEDDGNVYIPRFIFAEEEFANLLQSENALLRLLGFVSLICILISVFGFFSLVSLTCEERRKEIAIRKVNGATIHDIVGIFFKEYSLLLAIGALIAFPIGYYLMQRWLEQYVLQTAIPMWIYVAILLALTLVIVSCVGWRVWKASRENPADVVKAEF